MHEDLHPTVIHSDAIPGDGLLGKSRRRRFPNLNHQNPGAPGLDVENLENKPKRTKNRTQ